MTQASSKYDLFSTLQDPYGVMKDDPGKFRELASRLSGALTRMFRMPSEGGNVFLYSIAAGKPHILVSTDHSVPGLPKGFHSAATDGQKVYWHADFLESLQEDDVSIVIEHEFYHIWLWHHERMVNQENQLLAGWAFDYTVNGLIWNDHLRYHPQFTWGKDLGTPLSFKDCIRWLDGEFELRPKTRYIFADKSIYFGSPEEMYEELVSHFDKSPRKCKKCGALSINPDTQKPLPPGPCSPSECSHNGTCCSVCGAIPDDSGVYTNGSGPGSMDSHMSPAVSPNQVEVELMQARAAINSMQSGRGFVPSAVEEKLAQLEKPQMDLKDLMRSSIMTNLQKAGMINNWRRLRRRHLPRPDTRNALYKGGFFPTRNGRGGKWLALIDTSGSHQSPEIVYGISQLQTLLEYEGFVVPCDASVKWDDITPIKNLKDLQSTKIVGRGGTVFDEFFRDFPKYLGKDFDCIVVVTDGDCGQVPIQLEPDCDTYWLVSREHSNYVPSFGRVITRPKKL